MREQELIVNKDFEKEEGTLLFDMAWLMNTMRMIIITGRILQDFYMTACTGFWKLPVTMDFTGISGTAI